MAQMANLTTARKKDVGEENQLSNQNEGSTTSTKIVFT
jgi:hypothetical protein